jgi:AraC-like DNA-binding protein
MTPETFLTKSVSAPDQYEAWRGWFWPLLEVVPEQTARHGFAAENRVWKLGGMAISRVSAPAVRVVRTKVHMRRNPADHWVLSYCSRGSTAITTGHRSLEAPAGVPFIWSLGEESSSARTAVERVQIFMPRDTFSDIAPLLDNARGSALDTPLGRLLGDFLLSLERCLPDLAPEDLPRLTDAVRGMVKACIGPSAERFDDAKGPLDFGRLERVRQAVRKNLRSPALGPTMLCGLVGTSRSNLYRLLDSKGGVARYIQSQRLHEAHATLGDPANSESIATIAEGLCFADASSFSRAFRKEFGYSPTEARSAATAGITLPARRGNRANVEAGQFGDLLRGF